MFFRGATSRVTNGIVVAFVHGSLSDYHNELGDFCELVALIGYLIARHY